MFFLEATHFVIFLQLLLALSLGLLLGIERTLAGRVAGMRTYALVSLGSCLFIIIAGLVTDSYIGKTNFDPLRIAAGIITGIGFLCGGLIIFKDETVSGITTAAGIWVATGIGVAVGYKLYFLAVLSTLLTLFVLSALLNLEEKIRHGGFKKKTRLKTKNLD